MATRTDIRSEQQINEIDGYLELGMQEEALARIRATLNEPFISTQDFDTCVYALLQMEKPEVWRKPVEGAYGRLEHPRGDRARSAMLNYYFSVGEPSKAFRFFPRRSTKFFDAWTMMQVCLELDRLDEAKKVARYCSGVLAATEDDFTRASMIDALASYYSRVGNWDAALKLWEEAPDEPTFQRQRLCGIVKIHLMRALEATTTGLAKVAAAQQDFDRSTEIQMPGNTTILIKDTERELKDWEREIERLMTGG
jgi:tetratricopeptide (TPR) repeat protein